MDNDSDKYLYLSLEKLIKYPMSLEYKYNLRTYIHKYNVTPETDVLGILPIAGAGHTWYFANLDKITKHKNIRAILSLCTGETKKYGHVSDDLVILLSKTFNKTIASERNIIDCYDCGTVARAVFLTLIHLNRGALFLTTKEITRMKQMYALRKDSLPIIKECYNFLIDQDIPDCVLICSINLNLSGHVFILEKNVINNKAKYHIYQTCLNAYTLLDYIEQQDYINNEKSINITVFFDSLIKLFKSRYWGDNENLIFTELFSYLPNHVINQTSGAFEFSWTYVIYSER